MIKLGPEAEAMVKEREGYKKALPDGRCTTYYCPAGKLTIGWGCTEGIYPGLIWTREQAQEAFEREIDKHAQAVLRMVTVPLNRNQRDALISFSYNCGEGAFQHSTVLRRLNAGDYAGAAEAMTWWVKAHQGGPNGPLVTMPGLVIRRAREKALFLTPAEEEEQPPMPQAPVEDKPSQAEQHEEAHDALSTESWLYWLNRLNIKSLTTAAAAAVLFLKEHAVEIGAAAVLAVVLFEAFQYAQRQSLLKQRYAP